MNFLDRRATRLVLAVLIVAQAVTGLVTLALRSPADDDQRVSASATSTTEARRRRPSTSPSTSTTEPSSPATTAPGAPPEAEAPSSEQQEVLDTIRAQIADLRGLEWKRDLTVYLLSGEELQDRLRRLAGDEIDREQLQADEDALELLGLIPESFGYAANIEELIGGQTAGFYSFETEELFVISGREGAITPFTKIIIAHEMTHALTDQHFDLGGKSEALAADEAKTEEALAFLALIEGDATLTQNLWAERRLSSSERRQALREEISLSGGADVPEYLQEASFFPYSSGLDFVSRLYDEGDFDAVNDAYTRLPASTEHILHPSRYLGGEGSVLPPLPDLAAATGCERLHRSSLGEFDMSQVLGQEIRDSDAEEAADGWNGDVFEVVQCNQATAFVDRWEVDADVGVSGLAAALADWSGGWSGSEDRPGGDGRFSGPDGAGRIRVFDTSVELVIAEDTATVDRLVQVLG